MSRPSRTLINWLLALSVLSVAFNVYFATRSSRTTAELGMKSAELYVCPMHPQVRQDHPGDCPICGMKLVKQQLSGEPDRESDSLAASVHLSPSQEVLANVRTEKPRRETVIEERRAAGRIVAKESSQWKATVRVMGRVERTFVAIPGEHVSRGVALFELFSPDLAAAQREYLLATSDKRSSGDESSRAAIDKLRSLGMTDDQIASLESTHEISQTLTFRAPKPGTLMQKMVTEGEWVMPGMALLEFVDLSEVWVEGTFLEGDATGLRLGDTLLVQTVGESAREVNAVVSFVSPMVDMMTRTTIVRASLSNASARWRPGMFVSIVLKGRSQTDVLTVPEDAVLSTGRSQRVWVKVADGRYQPRGVQVGAEQDGRRAILSGIAESDEVVVSGGYLIDSDAQLRGVPVPLIVSPPNDGALKPAHSGHVYHTDGASQPAADPASNRTSEKSDQCSGEVYICTMCPEVLSNKPGRCPTCGMKLVKKER